MKRKVQISKFSIAVGFLIGLSFLFICAQEIMAAPAKIKYETVYFGTNYELNGPGAQWGEPCLKAVQLAVEEINAAGGFKVGEKHYKIQLLIGDNEGKPEKAVVVVNKQLSEHRPPVIFGSAISMGTGPVLELCKSRKDFIVLSHTTITQKSSPISPLIFALIPTLAWLAPDTVDYAVDKIGFKSIAMMANDDEYGHICMNEEFTPQFQRRKIKITDQIFFPPATQDYYSFLSRIKSNKPEAIMIMSYDAQAQGIIRQAMELGITKVFVTRGPSLTGGLPFKNEIDHYVCQAFNEIDNSRDPKILAYRERFKKLHGRLPDNANNDSGGLLDYDYAAMVVKAMQKAGTVTDVNAIAKALQETKHEGTVGSISFNEIRQVNRPFDGAHLMKGGKITTFPIIPKPELVPKK